MTEIEKLSQGIQQLREHLQRLMSERDIIVDSDIMTVSRMLDVLLTEYQKLLKEKAEAKSILNAKEK